MSYYITSNSIQYGYELFDRYDTPHEVGEAVTRLLTVFEKANDGVKRELTINVDEENY